MTNFNQPSPGQISNLIEGLEYHHKYGKLKNVDLSDFSKNYEIISTKSLNQIRFINALIINRKWLKLMKVLEEWGFKINKN